jgi:phospholipid transport system substrate-binding protein
VRDSRRRARSHIARASAACQASPGARIVTSPRSRIPIDYRLRRVGSRWVVYDIVIEGVSFVSSYEGHVNQTIERSSFGELAWKMRLKEVEAAIA